MPARGAGGAAAAAAAPDHKGYKFESLVKQLIILKRDNFPSWRKLIKNMAYFLDWDPAWENIGPNPARRSLGRPRGRRPQREEKSEGSIHGDVSIDATIVRVP